MGKTRRNIARLVVIFAALAVGSIGAAALDASVKTNAGAIYTGALEGLAPVLRLVDVAPLVGPATQYDLPLDSILQMWVEFPRIIVETAEYVLVGPYSAFSGIGELLRVVERGAMTEIPLLGVDAIAFGGAGFRALPRQWLGDRWLNHPLFVVRKPLAGTTAPATAAPATTPTVTATTTIPGETIVWNTLEPAVEEPAASGLPAWLGLVAVLAVVAALFLLPIGGGS